MKKTLFLILLFVICIFSFTNIYAIDNATLDDVMVSDEYSEILTDTPASFTDLSDLISNAPAGSTIELEKDYKYSYGDRVSSNGITINKKITINGNGHTIDASNNNRIFYITGSNVVLNNITFTNAYASDYGAAVYATSSGLKIINSTFKDSKTYYGIVFAQDSSYTIKDSTFKDNTGNGATAIYGYGNYGTISGSTFINNKATGDSAGAIFMQGTNGVIDNCIVLY